FFPAFSLVANSGELDSPLKLIKIAFPQSINWRVEVKKATKQSARDAAKVRTQQKKVLRLVEMNL
ncbi:hypothetical protein MNBD_BACTEROID06-592, partial [hydrothermal vent metagenome]